MWQDKDGRIHNAVTDEPSALADRIADADGAVVLPVYADERTQLFTAVMPDRDGVVRTRWRTEPASSDRNWAFLKALHRGEIVIGTVTQIASLLSPSWTSAASRPLSMSPSCHGDPSTTPPTSFLSVRRSAPRFSTSIRSGNV